MLRFSQYRKGVPGHSAGGMATYPERIAERGDCPALTAGFSRMNQRRTRADRRLFAHS